MENHNYKFQEEKDKGFKKLLDNQVQTFCKRISIFKHFNNISTEDKRVINVFVYENTMNIIWYKKHIWKEQFWRRLYFSISLVLLLSIPILIWHTTFEYAPGKDLDTGETIVGIVTIIMTSILAIHRFVTSWLEKRKFLSQFYLAFTELKNILFRLENNWVNAKAFDTSTNKLVKDFKTALNQAITESRNIVTEETKQYFETLSYPNIDIPNLLGDSSKSAVALISSFKSKKWNLEKIKKEAAISQAEIEKKKKEIIKLKTEIDIKKEKVTALQAKFDKKSKILSEKSKVKKKTEIQKLEIKQIETDLDSLRSKISILEIQITESEPELNVKMKNYE